MLLRTVTTLLIACALLAVDSDSAEARGRRGLRRGGARVGQSQPARRGQRFIPQSTAAEAPRAGFRQAFGPIARRGTAQGIPLRDRLGRGVVAGLTWRDVLGQPAAHGGNQGLPLQDYMPTPPAVTWKDVIGPPAAHRGAEGLPLHDTFR